MSDTDIFISIGVILIPIRILFLVLAQDERDARCHEKEARDVLSVTRMTFCDRRAITVLHPLSMAYGLADKDQGNLV